MKVKTGINTQKQVDANKPEKVNIPAMCLRCKKIVELPPDHTVFKWGLNYFCSGECEDRYAIKQ